MLTIKRLIILERHLALVCWLSFGPVSYGCFDHCTDEGCLGGFSLTMQMPDNARLPIGEYAISVRVEEDTVQYTCTVAETYEDSKCDDPKLEQSYLSHALSIHMDYPEEEDGENLWDPTQPPVSFELGVVYIEGRSMRGPESISISIELNETAFGQGDYTPVYERDNSYWGNEHCGFCEELVGEALVLSPKQHG